MLKFHAPCSYDDFVTAWGTPGAKSIWPYTYYSSVEDIAAAKKFPPISAFESKLRGDERPELNLYIKAKTEFYRRKLLPIGHADRIVSMRGWLKFYNRQDVQPLAFAIRNCFDSYYQYFNVDAARANSLPSLSQSAMYKNRDAH